MHTTPLESELPMTFGLEHRHRDVVIVVVAHLRGFVSILLIFQCVLTKWLVTRSHNVPHVVSNTL